ncbi:MAG: LysM peptidoglycan-binding domain-containing protein [Paludibacteraceae bacterium]|nr:LysM peptidoglycan-binding domain-containing protein [Paludibacteraceae bacterium]
MKRVLLFLIALCMAVIAIADPDYPIVQKDGRDYYQYTIQKGDGLYAIGKKFGVSQADLHNANPGLTENIREGAKLLIPIKKQRKRQETPQTIHVVEEKQTPYSIAKIYNVPLDTLIRYNPSIRNGIIHTGDTLIISYEKAITKNDNAVKHSSENVIEIPETIIVKERETLYSISRTYNVPMSTLLDLNPSAEDGLKKGQTLRLKPTAALVVSEEKAQEAAPVATPVVSSRKEAKADADALKIAYILPFSNGKTIEASFIEFYRGSLIALNRAKTTNAIDRDVEVWAWNTQGQKSVLDSILALDDLKKVDVIIGPGFTYELEPVIRYAKEHGKKIIVPFSSHIDKSLFYDKLYQFNPSQDYWWNVSIRREMNAHPADRYIIAHCTDNQKGNAFANKLISVLNEQRKSYVNVNITPENADSLIRANLGGRTVLLIANNSGVDVRNIVDAMSEKYYNNLTLWGFGKWGASSRRFAPTIYGSLFFDRSDEAYENDYLAYFKHKAVRSDVRFDLLGYDITTFVINKNGKYLQSDINFVKMDGRWLNTRIYRVTWNGFTLSAE